MNVVVGIMVHAAMEVTKDDRELDQCTRAVGQHGAVVSMRRQLLSAQPHLLGYRTMWDRTECAVAMKEVLPTLLVDMGTTREQFQNLQLPAEDRAQMKVHIDNLLLVILSLTGSISERTLDLWTTLSQHRRAFKHMKEIQEETLDALMHHEFFVKQCTFYQEKDEKWGEDEEELLEDDEVKLEDVDVVVPPHQRIKTQHMADLLKEGQAGDDPIQARLNKAGERLDIIFAVVLLSNAATIGIATDAQPASGSALDVQFRIVEGAFTGSFVFEWMMRWLLASQMREGDGQLLCGFLPRRWLEESRTSTFRSLIHAFPMFICDRFIVFDTLIIFIGLFDAIYFWILRKDFEASALNMVRLWRILRLTRILRTLVVLKELYVLVSSILISVRTLFWTVVLLTVILYGAGVLTTEIVGKTATQGVDPNAAKFRDVPTAMFTLLRMTTFDTWAEDIRILNDNGHFVASGILLLLLVLCGMGVLNMVVGIMCEAALSILNVQSTKDSHTFAVKQAQALDGITDHVEGEYNEDEMTRSILKDLLRHPKTQTLFKKSKLSETDVWAIFERVAENQRCPLQQFVSACSSRSVPLSQLDLVTLRLKAELLGSETKRVLEELNFTFTDLKLAFPMQWGARPLPRAPDVTRNVRQKPRADASRGSTLNVSFHVAESDPNEVERLEKALAVARHENRRLREALFIGPDDVVQ